jgi:aspartyl protease
MTTGQTLRRYRPRRLAYMVTSFLGVAAGAAGCAAAGLDESSAYRGDAGPVNWEIVGIRTNITPDERQIQWSYTVILRETAGRGVQFETIETSAEARGHAELMAGVRKAPFRARLTPRGEYRFNTNYGLSYTTPTSAGFGELPGGRGGVTVRYRLAGRDETGQSITVTIPVKLYPGAGTKVRAPGPPLPSVSPEAGVPAPKTVPVSGEMAPRENPSANPARQAADECASHSSTLKILDLSETGEVNFSYAAGEEDEFRDCYHSKLLERLQGRLVDAPGGPRRTSIAIAPLGTSSVVVVAINGTRARLLLDTGATMTLIRPRLAEGIQGLAEVEGLRPLVTVATGDSVPVPLVRTRSLVIGDFEVEGLHIGLYDVVPQLADVDGLLGTDVLHRFTVNVDHDARRLTIERKP